MKFSQLADYLEKLEKTSSRNEITQILADLFKKADPEETDKIVYLVLGQLAPNYKGIVLNLAERMMVRVMAQAFDEDVNKVRTLYKQKGDLGNVAEELNQRKDSSISVIEVFDKLMAITNESGEGSQERKVSLMAKLLGELDSLSGRYVARIPVGKLRLGFSDMTILDALSFMLKGDKSARVEIEKAFNVSVDIGRIASLIKDKGLAGVNKIEPLPGTPIRPSLCERLPSAEKILEKVGSRVYIEPKYDGFRSQVHIYQEKGEKKVLIFSRNLESTTAMFPDLVEAAKKIKVKNAIFDAEAIGYDEKTDRFLPFQETIQRKRKHGVAEAAISFPLRLFVFDVLYKDGQNLMGEPFASRRKVLEKINFGDHKIEITRQDAVSDPDVIRDFIKKYLSEGLEGAVIKKIDAPYKAGARGYHWVKYKKTTEKGVADTVDCLVMGVNLGKGKRVGFGAGAFLVGVGDKGRFKSVSKIGTGLTDEQWREIDRRTRALAVKEKPSQYEVHKNLTPDTWVRPSLVVEILADEITRSPIHTAGLALRFPRLIKFRDEKEPKDATTIKELTKLYQMQKILSR
jgi:DNA ligase-1